MRILTLAAVLGLSACAQLTEPQLQEARLSNQLLTVVLTNGEICRAKWRLAPEGHLPCGAGYAYRVSEVADPNILRKAFEGLAKALKLEGGLAPMASVEITDAQGQHTRFVSPPPVDMSDDDTSN